MPPKKPTISLDDDDFGAILNCAVRYSLGRRSYMPKLVTDFITPLLPYLSDITLGCFLRDLGRTDNYGDPEIDRPVWEQFEHQVILAYEQRKGENA